MNKNWNNIWGYASLTSFSDHYIIGIYTQRTGTKGPKPWRLPLDILSGDKVEQINHCLGMFNDHDPINSWEWIKSDIQEMAREYTAFRQK